MPRKGHSMVVMEGLHKYPVLVVYAGRNDTNYFGDTWVFNPVKRSWKLMHDGQPRSPGKSTPSPRDHHSAATHLSQMVVFGGRYGKEHETSYPLGECSVPIPTDCRVPDACFALREKITVCTPHDARFGGCILHLVVTVVGSCVCSQSALYLLHFSNKR